METTATNLRRNFSQILDQASRGELVEITHRGLRLRLVSPGGLKLSLAVRRPTLLVDPASIVESDVELIDSLTQAWAGDAQAL